MRIKRYKRKMVHRNIKSQRLAEKRKNEIKEAGKKVDGFLETSGIDINEIKYAPVIPRKDFTRPEFIEKFEETFQGNLTTVLTSLFPRRGKIEIVEEQDINKFALSMIKSLKDSDLESEYMKKISDLNTVEIANIIRQGSKGLFKNKHNREKLMITFLKHKDKTIIDDCMKVLIDNMKKSLIVEVCTFEDESEEMLIPYHQYSELDTSILSSELEELFSSFRIEVVNENHALENYIDGVEFDVNRYIRDIPSDLIVSEDKLMMITAANVINNREFGYQFLINGVYENISSEIADLFAYQMYRAIREDLPSELIEDSIHYLLGNYTKFILQFAEKLDDASSQAILGNLQSLHEMKNICKDILLVKLISPHDIAVEIFRFAFINGFTDAAEEDDN